MRIGRRLSLHLMTCKNLFWTKDGTFSYIKLVKLIHKIQGKITHDSNPWILSCIFINA